MRYKFSNLYYDDTKNAKKLKSSEYKNVGKHIIVDQGKALIAGYTDNEDGLYTDVPAIIFGDHTRNIKYIDSPFFLGADGTKVLKSSLKNVNYKYLYYLLKNASIPDTGYNRHFKWLKELIFKYHSQEQQNQIVTILDKLDLTITKYREELSLLDELAKARFVEMFGDPVTNPKGWETTSIGDECYYIKDGPHKSLPDIGRDNGGHPFISVRNIVNGYIDFSDARYISDEDYYDSIKKCHPEKGDMLYSKGGTTGIAKLIDIDEPFANWVHVAVLKFDKFRLNGIFFENMLNGDYCYSQSQRLTKGIANRDLVLSAMAQIKLYCPPLELQNQFASFVQEIDKSEFVSGKAIGQRENRWMQDVNHCVSKALVENNLKHTFFVLEDLSGIRNVTERVKTKDLYVSVSWSFYNFEQKLIYKAKWNQSSVIKVAPRYTSQCCPDCGYTEKSNHNKKIHLFTCKNCGYQSNDDRIGAMNCIVWE